MKLVVRDSDWALEVCVPKFGVQFLEVTIAKPTDNTTLRNRNM